jgi:hypothetical protein
MMAVNTSTWYIKGLWQLQRLFLRPVLVRLPNAPNLLHADSNGGQSGLVGVNAQTVRAPNLRDIQLSPQHGDAEETKWPSILSEVQGMTWWKGSVAAGVEEGKSTQVVPANSNRVSPVPVFESSPLSSDIFSLYQRIGHAD